ncbi:5-methyltetrahydropteroyltriglutamate--homocysteine S-methyltransferase [Helicobacter sp. MIT 21-1697]|uniref:5-methyltetrahydropteroyltriglutamate-- homocysteine S-methyltransferase n=1 Tax=Helicobacter sp. MIT 21-1697 TaxID=2993733 RepID=UPI00224AA1A0|nr:5-methyltetrahydropteroyltriglutamate--homocysteine S-methyltransferase [Helicobacter sp. MIT 21-1697]MCX2716945.1 5-methyltetrahydropteroyltriglutamate--homocysteine S-methyltransferase [Helicobacter sp. MIT 21-1697]
MSSILGFPRIGKNRELKKALESFWSGKCSSQELQNVAKNLRAKHWEIQKGLDYVCVNDFSLYDNVLDLAYALNAKPQRFKDLEGLEGYFAMARGHRQGVACEMTKWFNTNYHYVVPELSDDDDYKANIEHIKVQYNEALSLGYKPKISLIGLFTFFGLSKIVKGDAGAIFNKLKSAYMDLIDEVSALGNEVVVEFSEPIFALGLKDNEELFTSLRCIYDRSALECVYNEISKKGIKAIVSTFFEHSNELSEILLQTDIYGIGLDFIYGEKNKQSLELIAKSNKVLYAGVIDGRNIWVADIESKLALLEHIATFIPKERIVVSSSCSLLHLPFSKEGEDKIDSQILSWLSFAQEKIKELSVLESIFKGHSDSANLAFLQENKTINAARKNSDKTNNKAVRERVFKHTQKERSLPFAQRIKIQKEQFNFPILPTTTIGSFPQTPELRALRLNYKKGQISKAQYEEGIKDYIRDCVRFQEEIGIDVLVHGEPERNDMVEYFGEQLDGFVFSSNAWVQSYGSRCVKPPIIFGDVARPKPMTLEWSKFAQSLTQKVMKGMLTGPVTILNWSFVRDDLERCEVCKQIALAIADEIDDLQKGGIKIIQVDEAAFKEGYPLRSENIKAYESWALECFKISTAVALPQTQIHTHMCYSEFNDIIKTIEALDADVISIETARSGNELLKVFKQVGYTNEVGPGVYDIHSPRIPSVEELKVQIKALLEVLPKEQLWINPDCGLKTRKWEEVKPSLKNIVEAVKSVRESL